MVPIDPTQLPANISNGQKKESRVSYFSFAWEVMPVKAKHPRGQANGS